jgi:hypothetical protein
LQNLHFISDVMTDAFTLGGVEDRGWSAQKGEKLNAKVIKLTIGGDERLECLGASQGNKRSGKMEHKL